MVRKRSAYSRARAKRSRPKTPAPKTGWVIAELARISHVPVRTLRYYVERRLLVPTEFRGTATRYQRRELLRLLGIVRMKSELHLSLAEIEGRLRGLGDKDLEDWLRSGALPPSAAMALGHGATEAVTMTQASAARSTSQPSQVALSAATAAPTQDNALWHRVQLSPGLELMVSAAVSPAVRRAAQRICDEFGAQVDLHLVNQA